MTVQQLEDSPKPNPQAITVVVADHHQLVHRGLLYELEHQPDITVLGTAANSDTTLQLALSHRPDVLTMNLSMPGLPAVDLVRQVRAQSPSTHVLILTAHEDIEHILALLEAGATGYVLKKEPLAGLMDAIRVVARGKRWLSAPIGARLADHVAGKAAAIVLTSRQLDVLRLIAKGWTNAHIARELTLSKRTVDFHVEKLLEKLDVDNRTEAVFKAQQLGLLAPPK